MCVHRGEHACSEKHERVSRFFYISLKKIFGESEPRRGWRVDGGRRPPVCLAPRARSHASLGHRPRIREMKQATSAESAIQFRCRKISVHARPHGRIEPRLATLRAKDDVKDDLTERLAHGTNDDRTGAQSESRFQRWRSFSYSMNPGALPQAFR
jgi:hypothetical protein